MAMHFGVYDTLYAFCWGSQRSYVLRRGSRSSVVRV
jgi:hypothetical protein